MVLSFLGCFLRFSVTSPLKDLILMKAAESCGHFHTSVPPFSERCIHFAAHDGEPTNTFTCPTWIRDPDGSGHLDYRRMEMTSMHARIHRNGSLASLAVRPSR